MSDRSGETDGVPVTGAGGMDGGSGEGSVLEAGESAGMRRLRFLRRVTLSCYLVLLSGLLFGPHVCPEHGVVFKRPWGIVTHISWCPGRVSLRDVVLNLGAFFLLAVLMDRADLPSGGGRLARLFAAAGVALVLSTSAELFQQYLPGRLPSVQDIAVDVLGAVLGSVAAGLGRLEATGTGPESRRNRWRRPGGRS